MDVVFLPLRLIRVQPRIHESMRDSIPSFSDDAERRDWLIETLGEATCRKLGLFRDPRDLDAFGRHSGLQRTGHDPRDPSPGASRSDQEANHRRRRLLDATAPARSSASWSERRRRSEGRFPRPEPGQGGRASHRLPHATGDIVIVQDADLEYEPEQYPELIQPIVDDQADVVFGSRFIGESHRVLYFWHSLANKYLTLLSNMFTNLNLTDMEVCYKVFRREVIQGISLKSDRFGFEPEVTAKVARFKFPARMASPRAPAASTRSPWPITGGPIAKARRSG